MSLSGRIKQISLNAGENSSPCMFVSGTVSCEKPLTVRIDNRFDIKNDGDIQQIVLMRQFTENFYDTHKHKGFPGTPRTENESGGAGDPAFAAHSHVLKDEYWTNNAENTLEKREYYYGLKIGEKLVLLRNRGGQEYLVLGRLP